MFNIAIKYHNKIYTTLFKKMAGRLIRYYKTSRRQPALLAQQAAFLYLCSRGIYNKTKEGRSLKAIKR